MSTSLNTESINFNATSNRKAHHTADYEVPNLVVRRGQTFEISIKYNRKINAGSDEVKFIFQLGLNPLKSKGTEVHVSVGTTLDNHEWNAMIAGEDGNQVSYKLISPANAIIGEWRVIVQTLSGGNRHQFTAKEPVYILFNPWCQEDLVYMSNEAQRTEYVLEQGGLLWRGSAGANGPSHWNYAQFDSACFGGALLLLRKSGLDLSSMGNPVLVSRTLSRMANSNDNDGGVLSGNWSDDFGGGKFPMSWQGSGSIMEQYMRTESDVKWAQCWVFSGLLTTLCRALGIPARSVSNFESAHDKDLSMTIDTHYDMQYNPLPYKDDSVWNFHVWNESYFARPDLPAGYDGWQAIDSTPQELSDNLMQCGPAPVAAIKNGHVHIDYDCKFVFGEVNGDRVTWMVEPDGKTMYPVEQETDSVGKEISTKAVGVLAREYVTNSYKHPEGSPEERATNTRAMEHSTRRKHLEIDESKNDCSMTLKVKSETNANVTASVTIINHNQKDKRKVSLKMVAVAAYYTGRTGEDLKYDSWNTTIEPETEEHYELRIPAAEWINIVAADATVKVFATAVVAETKQMMSRQKAAAVDKPHLKVTANPTTVVAGHEFEVNVSFTNPLEIPVTAGLFDVEGPGKVKLVEVAVKDIAPGQTVNGKAKFTPLFPGKREVVAGFNSRQLTGITGSCSINVTSSV